MANQQTFQVGDRFIIGQQIIELSEEFHRSLAADDQVLAVAATKSLKRIPSEVISLVERAVASASDAFSGLAHCSTESVNSFFDAAGSLLADDEAFAVIDDANKLDVADARSRGRSTTRLVLDPKMRSDMIQAFHMWRDADMIPSFKTDEVVHNGWSVEQWRAPLGVVGFVFEGRPNVFADATGVLKSGNTVVFRIGSDALRTAQAIMDVVIVPALRRAQLPDGSVQLIASREHAAGWKLFSDRRIALAVARGSGEAVAELGSIAQQSGVPVSLHGTGGAWMIVGESAQLSELSQYVEHSLDRKVCNTMNVICVPVSKASIFVPVILESATRAAGKRNTAPRIHAVNGAEKYLPQKTVISVRRADGAHEEEQISVSNESALGHEFEWEENPEFFIVLTESTEQAMRLFNQYSPQFVVSAITDDESESELIWNTCNAPFFGNGFTRWVDGQFALLRPELGLSNWQSGRLFSRSGILSGDSAFTVRLRVRQSDAGLHR